MWDKIFKFYFGAAVALICFLMGFDCRADERPLEEVVVDGRRYGDLTIATPQTEQLLRVPGTLGDPLRAIFALPGVVEASDGEGQPAVRGTGPGDNTFLIDFLPAGYVFHDFGNSVINENLIRDFGLKTAGFGPRYGQATGAIFDISLREPRQQPVITTVNASFLQASALVEGRLTDTQAFYVSVRESLIHIILDAIDANESLQEEDDLNFDQYPRAGDYQIKYAWTPNDNQHLSVLATGANDRIGLNIGANSEEALLDPGSTGRASVDTSFNSLGAVWRSATSVSELQAGVGVLREKNRDRLGGDAEFQDIETTRLTGKVHYGRDLGRWHRIAVGAEHQRANFDYSVSLRFLPCSQFDPSCDIDQAELVTETNEQDVISSFVFVEDQWQVNENFTLTAGLQFVNEDYLDESSVEPRVRAQYDLSPRWSVNAAYGRYSQLPAVDEIVPVFGNPQLTRPRAAHYVAGVTGDLGGGWSAQVEGYYKDLDRLPVAVDDDRNYTSSATGEAYGVEMMLRKETSDNWFGWLSLAWSRSERTNELSGITSRADIDTPLVANLVLNYQLGDWNLGGRWQYRSGMPYTPIVGNRENGDFAGYYLPVYGQLNAERAGPYHRLDLRAERPFRLGRFDGKYFVDVINAYGRRNGGEVFYEPIAGGAEFRLEESDGLPFIPSIGFEVSF